MAYFLALFLNLALCLQWMIHPESCQGSILRHFLSRNTASSRLLAISFASQDSAIWNGDAGNQCLLLILISNAMPTHRDPAQVPASLSWAIKIVGTTGKILR
jgi:hypothetical protein